jgi:hypothetical protein
MIRQTSLFDPCERKHGGNAESRAAWQRASRGVAGARADVLRVIREADGGATSKEVAAALGRGLNAISGRLTELAAAGAIRRTGERRDNAAVWRAI